MWCDSFDADLYKLIPEARDVLAPVAAIPLWTHGHLTEGKLNHPAAWNTILGTAAFFGTREGLPGRPDSFYTQDPVVRCTFEEAVRDLWAHHLVMLVDGSTIWNTEHLESHFTRLMYHARGWALLDADLLALTKRQVVSSLIEAVTKLQLVLS